MVERSAGTLLIEELAGLATRSGEYPPLPDVVRVTVRERAGRLGPAGRDLLELAAVAGLSVDARLLRALRPEAAPDELVAAGLVEPDRDGFRFRHPLLQELHRGGAPGSRRQRASDYLLAMWRIGAGGWPGPSPEHEPVAMPLATE